MTMQELFRDAIGWAATYGEGRHALTAQDWDRIADAKARVFAAKADAERWQPIDTVPRHKWVVLHIKTSATTEGMLVGRLQDQGRWEFADNEFALSIEPTHWMLPGAPQQEPR